MVEFFCVFFAFIFYFRFYADEPAACLPRLCPTVEAGTPPRRRVCGRGQRDYSILLPICKSFCNSAGGRRGERGEEGLDRGCGRCIMKESPER